MRANPTAADRAADAGHAPAILRRVGIVLVAAGALDLAVLVWATATGHFDPSPFNVFAIGAGVLLYRASLRTARLVVAACAALLAAWVAGLALLPLVVPAGLLAAGVRVAPAFGLAAWAAGAVAAFALLAWVLHALTRAPVQAALRDAGLAPRRFWQRPRASAGVGVALAALLAALSWTTNHGAAGREAIARARQQRGAGYGYFVTALSADWPTGAAPRIHARVLAYTDDSIEMLQLEWRQ